MTSKAFDRGMRAKQKGRPLERNPFKKRAGKANARKAVEWEEGWHAAIVRVVVVPGDWTWPDLEHIPHPPAGDYETRERGLYSMFRPRDLIEWDVLRASMQARLVPHLPQWAVIPYDLLAAFSDGSLPDGETELEPWVSHPLKYLWSALRIQGTVSRWPPLVVSAYEELIYGKVPEALQARSSENRAAGGDRDDEGE